MQLDGWELDWGPSRSLERTVDYGGFKVVASAKPAEYTVNDRANQIEKEEETTEIAEESEDVILGALVYGLELWGSEKELMDLSNVGS